MMIMCEVSQVEVRGYRKGKKVEEKAVRWLRETYEDEQEVLWVQFISYLFVKQFSSNCQASKNFKMIKISQKQVIMSKLILSM